MFLAPAVPAYPYSDSMTRPSTGHTAVWTEKQLSRLELEEDVTSTARSVRGTSRGQRERGPANHQSHRRLVTLSDCRGPDDSLRLSRGRRYHHAAAGPRHTPSLPKFDNSSTHIPFAPFFVSPAVDIARGAPVQSVICSPSHSLLSGPRLIFVLPSDPLAHTTDIQYAIPIGVTRSLPGGCCRCGPGRPDGDSTRSSMHSDVLDRQWRILRSPARHGRRTARRLIQVRPDQGLLLQRL